MGQTTAECFFWGVLGLAMPGKVRTGWNIGDYSPSAWTPVLVELKSYTSKQILFTS